MTYRNWDEALADMERRLAAAERILAGEDGVDPPPPFEPLGLGPLPPSRRERAEAVHSATRRLEERLSSEMAAIAELLLRSPAVAAMVGGGGEGPPPPSYIDRRA